MAGTSSLIREYIWLGMRSLAVVEGGQIYSVRTDHIGRPVFATGGNGSVVWEASYSPFGGVLTSTCAPMELRFPGQWFQSGSGLHQNWMRDYDPTTGRYIRLDPLGLVDGASVYGYALQNRRGMSIRGGNSVSLVQLREQLLGARAGPEAPCQPPTGITESTRLLAFTL